MNAILKDIIAIICFNVFLAVFDIGTTAERVIINILGLIYWKMR